MLASSRMFYETPDKRDSVYYYDYHSSDEEYQWDAVTVSEQRAVGVLV